MKWWNSNHKITLKYGRFSKEAYEQHSIANITWQRADGFPSNTIGLHLINQGIDAIKDYWLSQTDSSQPYIIERSQRFPCFDAEDYATEWRFYRNFLICHSKQEADKKTKDMKQLRENSNFCLVNKNLPADMRPIVYYEDESTSMLLAYWVEIIWHEENLQHLISLRMGC